jgi:hypothetical protein
MTLLDAPQFDAMRSRRNLLIVQCSLAALVLLFITWWLVSSRPVDWPWNWNRYLFGRITVNKFLTAVEADDLPRAYGIWVNDKNWQQHPDQHSVYPYARFQGDWSPTSPDNEYGAIKSHKIVAATMHGNVLLMAVLVNERKSKALNLVYDPKTHTLDFSPPDVEIYLGP